MLRGNAIARVRARALRHHRVTDTKAGAGPRPGDWAAKLGLPADVGIVARLVRLDLFVRRVLDDLCGAEGIAVADYLVLAVVRRSRRSGRTVPSVPHPRPYERRDEPRPRPTLRCRLAGAVG